jgi:hypothetical protein
VLLGCLLGDRSPFDYGAVTRCGGPFHGLRLDVDFVTPRIFRRRCRQVPRHRDGNAVGLDTAPV